MWKKKFVLGLVLLMAVFPLMAQRPTVTVTATFDSTHILIGDHLKLHLTAKTQPGHNLKFQTTDRWRFYNCEALQSGQPSQSASSGEVVLKQDFILTSFDVGQAQVAPIWVVADDTIFAAYTDTLSFFVDSLPVYVDTSKAFRDIRLPVNVMEPATGKSGKGVWKTVAVVLGIILAVALLAFLFIKYLWPRISKLNVERKREEVKRNSGAYALGQIQQLKQKELCQKGLQKEHYAELSVILRTYMKDQWDVNAMEMVTDQIMEAMAKVELSDQQVMELRSFFHLSDYVKYARQQPSMEENVRQTEAMTRFVADTDRMEQVRKVEQKPVEK